MNAIKPYIRSLILAVSIVMGVSVLTGCAPTKQIEVVYQTQTQYQSVPAYFTQPINAPAPISSDEYIALSPATGARERYLTDYSAELMAALHTCNLQLETIGNLSKQWKEVSHENQPTD